MEPFISNDSFDAFRTDNGIEIHEKKVAAKKFSVIIIVVGLVFIGISFIPIEGLTYDWITTMFQAVFLYGGILLFVLGLLVLILKGSGNKQTPITELNVKTKILTLRNKEIPFGEMSEVHIQTTEAMNRKMTAILFKHKGRNKGFISGIMFTDDLKSIENFVEELNALLKGDQNNSES